MKYAEIAIDVPLRQSFTYKIPADFTKNILPGIRVVVPFGRQKIIGICLSCHNTAPKNFADSKIKNIERIIEEKTISSVLLSVNDLKWLQMISEYYAFPVGQVIAQAIPDYYFDLKKIESDKIVKAKKIEFAHTHVKKDVELTAEQNHIFQKIDENSQSFYPVLIHGITGSGKTEIYIQLIHEVLKRNQSALYLVPEIGLTTQTLSRLHHHFPDQLLIFHSGLTQNQKLLEWQKCLQNKPVVMVGTRSAIFAPLGNLGMIVIDEEQDSSFKQEERFRYHARDIALMRAQILKIPVIMGSATPSLETYYLSQNKKYHYFQIKNRIFDTKLPEIQIVNIGKEKEQRAGTFLLSQHIHQAITRHYNLKEQMILFAGQRGYAQNAYCIDCEQIINCPNCSIGLTFHKPQKNLKCHYCDYAIPFNEVCPTCQQKSLTLLGSGTQSIEEEIQSLHPKLKVIRMDSDSMTSPQKLQSAFQDFIKGKINMLIGTQILAKGHDFNNLGFVGVVNIDANLGLPDFRSSEKAFQTLVQVAGRAGRNKKQGQVIVQSFNPSHPSLVLGATHDYKKFADYELQLREELFYPPFSRLIQFRFLSNHQNKILQFFADWQGFLQNLTKELSAHDIQILGPAPMPLEKIRGKYRYHLIIKLRRGIKSKDMIHYILQDVDNRKLRGIQCQVDVDPMSLL